MVIRKNLGIFNKMKSLPGLSHVSPPLAGSVLTIGNFDGLHLGHQALMRELVAQAQKHQVPAVVLTFDPHPAVILAPHQSHQNLFDKTDLLEGLQNLGLDLCVIEPFTLELSRMKAEPFLSQKVRRHLNPKVLVVGHDFAFGADRSGTQAMLQTYCLEHKIELCVLPPVMKDETPVSSSRIRNLLRAGNVEAAEQMLARPYFVSGEVVAGMGRGRTIGIPTANLKISSGQLPASGVYVTSVFYEGAWRPSVSNVGWNPTFQSEAQVLSPSFETHIFDSQLHLYGQHLKIRFHRRLREERRFENPQQLVAQIQKDMQEARQFFNMDVR